MSEKCQYPGCSILVAGTYSLVPLCQMHEDVIRQEMKEYYGNQKKPEAKERRNFRRIADKIPEYRKAVCHG